MAETVVVADNVTLLGQNIQSKVGQTLVGATAVANNTKRDSSGSLGVLDTIADLQRKTIDKITKVFDALQAGVKFDKNEARLVREEKKEDNLEKKSKKETAFDSILKGELPGESGVSTFLGGFLAGKWGKLLTITGLLAFTKGIFKVGFLSILGGYIGGMLMSGLVKDKELKSQMQTYLSVGLGFAMFGKKGIAAGLLLAATMGITSLYEWFSGQKRASDFSGFEWGHIALTGPALIMAARVGGLTMGTKLLGTTLGALIGGWPFVIAASLAIALAAGIGYVSGEMEEYRASVLDHLHKITSMTQKTFNDNMAMEEEKWYSKINENLAGAIMGDDKLTTQQKLLVGMKEARERAEGKDPLSPSDQKKTVDATSQMANQTLDKEKFDIMMADEYKMGVMMRTVEHIMKIIDTGKLAPEDKKIAQDNLGILLDHIEASAKETIKLNKSKGIDTPAYMEDLALSDKFERETEIAPKIDILTKLIAAQETQLETLKKAIVPDIVYNKYDQEVDLSEFSKEAEDADKLHKILKINKKKLHELEQTYRYGKVRNYRTLSTINLAMSDREPGSMNLSEAQKNRSLLDIKNVFTAERTKLKALDLSAGSFNIDNSKKAVVDSRSSNNISLYGHTGKNDSEFSNVAGSGN